MRGAGPSRPFFFRLGSEDSVADFYSFNASDEKPQNKERPLKMRRVDHRRCYDLNKLLRCLESGTADELNVALSEIGGINVSEAIDVYGRTPLILATTDDDTLRSKTKVTLLLDRKADVNFGSDDNTTPLLKAVETGCELDVVDLLISARANVNSCNSHGTTPLLKAVEMGCELDVVDLLIGARANVNSYNSHGTTPLLKAVTLTMSARNGDTNHAKLLIEKKANVNQPAKGITPLHIALDNPFKNNEQPQLVELLLDRKANVNFSSDDYGNKTPLLTAVEKRCDVDIVEPLLDRHADVNSANTHGTTPLLIALNKNPEIVESLLSRNANVDPSHILFINYVLPSLKEPPPPGTDAEEDSD